MYRTHTHTYARTPPTPDVACPAPTRVSLLRYFSEWEGEFVFAADLKDGRKNVLHISNGTGAGTRAANLTGNLDLQYMQAGMAGCGAESMHASCFGGTQQDYRYEIAAQLQLNGYSKSSFDFAAQAAFRAGVAFSLNVQANEVRCVAALSRITAWCMRLGHSLLPKRTHYRPLRHSSHVSLH